jgi:hypothetical protein
MPLEALYYCDESGCYQGISSKTAFASQFCFVPYDEAHGSPCPQWFPVFSAGESMIMILLLASKGWFSRHVPRCFKMFQIFGGITCPYWEYIGSI